MCPVQTHADECAALLAEAENTVNFLRLEMKGIQKPVSCSQAEDPTD